MTRQDQITQLYKQALAPSGAPVTVLRSSDKTVLRRAFLETCTENTRRIHNPIAVIEDVKGHPNPAGLGNARKFSRTGSLGQSSVLFDGLEVYEKADQKGSAPYGGAEYGVVCTPEVERVCAKLARLHHGAGAVLCVSGLAAITTTLETFKPKVVLVPDNVYYPVTRYLADFEGTRSMVYRPDEKAKALGDHMNAALKDHRGGEVMAYIEAPGSGTFEIPDISTIVKLARARHIRTVMDNTYASHVRFTPITHGVDIAIQATTKYEGGYGDTPSGAIITKDYPDLARLQRRLRISGQGAFTPATAARLERRLDSTEQRMNRHFATAQKLMDWFAEQEFIAGILCPARKDSPYHQRFKEYFGKGNGLFTAAFGRDVPPDAAKSFINELNLFRVAESWGGHVSMVQPVNISKRMLGLRPEGVHYRFHAGLESPADLLRDLTNAQRRVFPSSKSVDIPTP